MRQIPQGLLLFRPRLAVLTALVALSGCAVPSGALPRTPAPPPLKGASGVILAAGGAEVIGYDLATQERIAFRLPSGTEEIIEGRWIDEGAALVAARVNGANALYRVTANDAPEQASAPITAGRFDLQDQKVLASACRFVGPAPGPSPGRFESAGADRQTGRISLLDLDAERRWSVIARGCVAALSPEADLVAHSPDGRTLSITRLDDGGSQEVFDVGDLGLEPASGKPFTIKGPIAWGRGGIAVALDADGSDTILRLSSDGELLGNTLLEPQSRDFFLGLAWSPDGDRLAIPAYTYLGYVNATGSVALTDGDEEGYRVISVHPYASGTAVWAPDGKSLLVAGDPREPWIVTDLDGTWLQRVGGQEAVPLDWRAP
jgi:hypothetical protein